MTIDELINVINSSPQHKSLYHFTDEANLPSIDTHGLLSKEQLRLRGLWPPLATGGNELSWQLDRIRGIDPCVSLCMTRNHSMKHLAHEAGRLPNPRYMAIDPKALKIPGTRIAFGIANANDVTILPLADAVDRLDVEVLYTRMEWKIPEVNARLRAAEKVEILIPDAVPQELIIGYY